MKKNLFVTALVALIAAMAPVSSDAQGLGDLLKKGKKALEAVTGSTSETTKNNTQSAVTKSVTNEAQTFENGIQMINSISEYMDVTPIGLYGVPTSENYGNVYLVLKVMMKEPANRAGFGGVGNDKMIAVDANGKVYPGSNGNLNFDTPEGIPVQVVMNQPQLMFEGVKKEIKEMPMVKFGIFIDAYHKGGVTLKNVPIFWDETPE